MAANIDLTSQKWLDLIFEGRNHSYGAYVLRQQSSKRHLIAFVFSMTFVVVAVFTAITLKKVNDTIINNRVPEGFIQVSDYDLAPPPPPEEIIEHRVEAPPPVELAKTISYQVPKIMKDELVKEEQEMKAVDDVLKDDGLVSILDNKEGRTDGLGVDPADLIEHKNITGNVEVDETIYNTGIVEQSPSFPGGESAMYEWLSKNINYPVIAQENNIQGRVVLQFVVGKNGEITDIFIARGVDASLDKEAVRVVKNMPKWIPGKQGGNAVRVRYTLPVQFRLQ